MKETTKQALLDWMHEITVLVQSLSDAQGNGSYASQVLAEKTQELHTALTADEL